MSLSVNPRSRQREDRAGDPLDGLVNLFDLGIVLSVAFLLAALSSLDLTAALFREQAQRVPEDAVIVNENEDARPIELERGETVVGRGEPVGTVYRLDDGRTIIVEPEATGQSGAAGGAGSGATGESTTGEPGSPGSATGDQSSTTGEDEADSGSALQLDDEGP